MGTHCKALFYCYFLTIVRLSQVLKGIHIYVKIRQCTNIDAFSVKKPMPAKGLAVSFQMMRNANGTSNYPFAIYVSRDSRINLLL